LTRYSEKFKISDMRSEILSVVAGLGLMAAVAPSVEASTSSMVPAIKSVNKTIVVTEKGYGMNPWYLPEDPLEPYICRPREERFIFSPRKLHRKLVNK
jgi:hypothetical protein